MKTSILILFLLEHVMCKNLETDLARTLTETDKYSSRRLQSLLIAQDDIILNVYTQADTTGAEVPLTDANNLTSVSPFNTALKTIFFVHGWKGAYDVPDHSSAVRAALLASANVNVIIVTWDACADNINYLVSRACVPDVGDYVGEFIETVSTTYSYPLTDITVVGHSLGAHIAGYIGKYNNGDIGVIVGLDPAGPSYLEALTSQRLYEDDAVHVQGIHTNGLLYGVNYDVGHADFWPNGGYLQNSCGEDSKCSHEIAVNYYTESVTNNTFYARQCSSYLNWQEGDCVTGSEEDVPTLMGGVEIDTSAFGDYYLDTNAESPYGMGNVA